MQTDAISSVCALTVAISPVDGLLVFYVDFLLNTFRTRILVYEREKYYPLLARKANLGSAH